MQPTYTATTGISHLGNNSGTELTRYLSPWLEIKELDGTRSLFIDKKADPFASCKDVACKAHAIAITVTCPSEELEDVDSQLGKVTNHKCQGTSKYASNIRMESSAETALKVVDLVMSRWGQPTLKEGVNCGAIAKSFITEGPAPEVQKTVLAWNAALEAKIRQTMAGQSGAIALVDALKSLPYDSDMDRILERLAKGCYGFLTSSNLDTAGQLAGDLRRRNFDDLATRALNDDFEHPGPRDQAQQAMTEIQALFKL